MLRKNRLGSVLLLLLVVQSAVAADEGASIGFWDVLPETIIRPLSFVGFLGGCTLFIISTPFTAAASVEAPHDAWLNSYNGFVGAPVRYTFTRPLGDYRFDVFPE